ncbi:hypothetical protein KJ612_07320 [Myxococcota bacterium]|nr:hypothetical protein [Myxococcota bacterium]
MKNSLRILTATLFSMSLAACSAGPTGENGTEPEVEAGLHQGVQIIDLQPDFSFTASFAKGDHIIFVQAVRGNPTPEQYRRDSSSPKFEVDARITDELGRYLYVRRGGDDFVDPTWLDDQVMQDSLPVPVVSNRALFEMIPEAMEAIEAEIVNLHGAAAVASLVPELKAVNDFGRTAPVTFEASDLEVIERVNQQGFLNFEAGGGGSEGPEDAQKYFISGWYSLTLHDKDGTVGLYRHSATRIRQLRYGGVYSYYDFCNHGDCASSMGQIGSLSQIQKPAWTAMTCSTGYSAKSQDGGHNCHDDSRVQMASFVFGPVMNRDQYWCNDGDSSVDISNNFWYGDQEGSPEANDSTNRGYNHPSMQNFWTSNTNSAQQNTANFNIILAAGATYDIYTCGHASGDTYIRLFKDGVQVSGNDDNCGGLQSYLTYTAPTAGTYQVRAGCFGSNSCNGAVRVRLASASTSPAATFYSAENTNSALQNTVQFAYYLSRGYTYTFSTCGTSDTDTYLRLKYNGTDVAVNDDACGVQSSISFSPTTAGYYYIHAGCFSSGKCSGTVNMSSVQNPVEPAEPVKYIESYSY